MATSNTRFVIKGTFYQITNGPGAQKLGRSLIPDLNGPPGIDMLLANSCQFTLGTPGMEIGKVRVTLTGLEYGDGSGTSFNMKGHTIGHDNAIVSVSRASFKGYYNLKTSKGWIEFTD